jgi:hypothetical protein
MNTTEYFLALSKQELETLKNLFKRLPPFSDNNPCTELEKELLILIFEGTNHE